MKKRILLMYISKNSGHHRAALAIENAFHELTDDVDTFVVNSFNYTNPILEKIVNRTYMSIIKRKPEVWGYLYDNPKVVKRTQRLRESIHKYNSNKIRSLMEQFKPQAVICTQAFPCGIIADYKKTHKKSSFLLAGVLTDYAPHAYWLFDEVDAYFVPSKETKEKLVANGIPEDKVKPSGIPIDPKFRRIIDRKKIFESLGLSCGEHVVIVMGGSQGIGPIKDIIKTLERMPLNFQIIVVTGNNKKLYRYLKRRVRRFSKKILVFGFVDNMDALMQISSLVISKAGGITISEALARGLPLLIVKPIPGHEQMNTDYLIKNKVAIKIDSFRDMQTIVRELLSNPSALKNMQERARLFSKPESALEIAKTLLQRIM